MKRRILSTLLAVMMVLTMLPSSVFAAEVDSEGPETVQVQDSGNNEDSPVQSSNIYEVSSDTELKTALDKIADSDANEAVIVLKADLTAPTTTESSYATTFGANGKHITVCSTEGNLFKLNMASRGILTGDCTFDNVNVTGSRLFCNGYRTIFTENGQIHLSETLYGGGYKTTVDSTHVVIAASGYINPSSSSGLHDVIGGSYQGSVEGDTYLEITGDIQMQGGNILTPACMMGDGTSGNGKNSPDVYVGGNATLVYDTVSTSAPSIAGTDGCEIKGNVTLDIRSGHVTEISGHYEYAAKSDIDGDVHIIAGAQKYENTDRVLQLYGSDYSCWPIIGAGTYMPSSSDTFQVKGNVTIDAYENVWGWDKDNAPPKVTAPIIGAKAATVGKDVTLNIHGSHLEALIGAEDSTINGNITINAQSVELKDAYYETKYDGEDITGNLIGLNEEYRTSTATGSITINADSCDTALIIASVQETVNEGSSINITGKPKIRVGILGTTNSQYSSDTPTVNVDACSATIPFIQEVQQVNVTNKSNITCNAIDDSLGLMVEENSSLITDEEQIWIWGNAVINGTWEQQYVEEQTGSSTNYNDVYVKGTTTIGENGRLIDHGTSDLKGAVTNNGMMVLMAAAYLQNDYIGNNSEIRLPAVDNNNYDGTGDIPLLIKGDASGTTNINTVKPDDWQTLQIPVPGDNYILAKKNGDDPAQAVFLLGNEDAMEKGYFLKRLNDADTSDDAYYMWQVANGVRVIFDKNGGDTEASPRIMSQEKVAGSANHFDLPTTNPTRTGYLFNGWNTKADGAGAVFTAETDVTDNMTVYAQWKPDEAYAVKIAPMNLTVYVGGDGYHGVIGEDGKFAANDLPEIGFYITLPDDINTMLGGTDENPVNLSDKLCLTYNDENGTTRSWSLELYGDETMSHVTENGRKVYIYKLLPSQINDTTETVPARVQFTRADGSVMVDSEFKALLTDQFRNYKISFFPGQLDEQFYQATFTTTDGRTLTRPIKLGTGTLKVRGNNDTTYRAIEDNTTPSVNPQDKDIMLVSTAQADTQYYINNSGVSADADGVRLLVDHSLDDALLSAYINRTSNTEGKYTYQFRYLDLVDTHNGNAYVMMGEGQKMNLYWPVPSDAKPDSEFHIIHFKGIDRDSNADVNDLLTTHIPEEINGEKVTINGQQFVKFSTDSFSPFALLYEKGQTSGGGSSGGSSGGSTKYTLHYESNGGTSYKDESYASGTTVTLDKAPVRESYTFTGWYADKALTDKITNVKMTGNKTVYAGWEATGVPDKLNGDDHYAYVVGYKDGTVRPNANISRAEVATIFFRLLKADVRDGNLTDSNTFADVKNGQWCNKAISTMAKLGVVKGRSANGFDPNAPITRAEFAAICARFDTNQTDGNSNFTDISGHWAAKEIQRAATLGWIAGYSDGTFRPNKYITRAEAMTMINRVLCRMPQSKDDLLSDMVSWPDNKPTDWHYLAVQEATNSHDFDRKGEVNEKWTKLTTVPDWSRYQ